IMNRLLLGDVGTGKTVVAALALAAVADSGTQAAMMAPTSVLAKQYAEKIGPLLTAADIPWALVTGSTPVAERTAIENRLATGAISVIFGTSALLSEGINFRQLTLIVIDEQHRFGVNQRSALRKKGSGVDLLAMTATPIPRTLALSIYGDIALSRIAHRPLAGAGLKTELLQSNNLDLAYGAVRDAVAAGQQAYVVCPLIDETDEGANLDDVPPNVQTQTKLHSALATYQALQRGVFSDLRIGILTGRMSSAEKDEVMEKFRSGDLDVLVSTTVIEVGIDVPNATVMLIYNADRFGLATLHQLRGRVGRGSLPGKVFLNSDAKRGTPARRRLAAL
ncbi:MAG: DEAD/DEAH box helicase, partial [Lancefieldella rimae]|nr:DEAD/DEAH box helicase [Lancefieldella rimae]